MRVSLFNFGEFKLHSGESSCFKIDCDALTDEDIEDLAKYASQFVRFGKVVSIPTGGDRLAKAMAKYKTKGHKFTLIVDDVCTSGLSFWNVRNKIEPHHNSYYFDPDTIKWSHVVGLCIFCRKPNDCPSWVFPLFTMKDFWPPHGMYDELPVTGFSFKSSTIEGILDT